MQHLARTIAACTIAACAIAAASSATAHASSLFVTNPGTGGIVFDVHSSSFGSSNVIGWQIQVGNAPLSVSKLGFFDYLSDGLESPMLVGLWKSQSATLLASVTVPAGAAGELLGGYRFTYLSSPVTLDPNTLYTLGYRMEDGGIMRDARNMTGQTFSTGAIITLGGMNNTGSQPYGTDFATQMPTNFLGDSPITPLTGPNFAFDVLPTPPTAVPTPASALSGLVLAGGLVAWRRARNNA